MRFTHIDANFDVTYASPKKTLKMSIESIFDHFPFSPGNELNG